MAAGERDTRERDYCAYLLRLWRVTAGGETVWRASLENPHTGKRAGFCNLDALFDHLRARTERRQEGGDV